MTRSHAPKLALLLAFPFILALAACMAEPVEGTKGVSETCETCAEDTGGTGDPGGTDGTEDTGGTQEPPSVYSISPSDGSTGIDRATAILVTFSRAMDTVTVESAFSLGDGTTDVTGTFGWNADETEVTFTPTDVLTSYTGYTTTIAETAAESLGTPLAASFSASFTTADYAPSVNNISPSDGATGIDRASAIVVTFSRAMDTASAESAFALSDGTTEVAGTFAWNGGGTEVTFSQESLLREYTIYTVTIAATASEALGAPMAAAFSSSFTTRPVWTTIAAGGGISLAIRSNGTVWAWGEGYGNWPVQVGTNTEWVAISAGWANALALNSEETLWAWGANGFGQLGLGDMTDRTTPTQVGMGTTWTAFAAGTYDVTSHALAVKSDGTLWAWGSNDFGQLGKGDTTDRNTPTQVGTESNWEAPGAGWYHTLALKSDGTIWAWGSNGAGQLGQGDNTDHNIPTQVGTDIGWTTFSAGGNHNLALKSDGTIWAWGTNNYGQLGLGDMTNRNTPTQMGTDTDWTALSAGGEHNLALKADGTIWAWGANDNKQLGQGDTTDRNTPTQVGTDTDWTALSAGEFHNLALKSDGTLWAWGENWFQQMGTGGYSDIPVRVPEPTEGGELAFMNSSRRISPGWMGSSNSTSSFMGLLNDSPRFPR